MESNLFTTNLDPFEPKPLCAVIYQNSGDILIRHYATNIGPNVTNITPFGMDHTSQNRTTLFGGHDVIW